MPPDPFALLVEWAAPATRGALEPYYDDPVGFARDCIAWPEGEELAEYQEQILREIVAKLKVSVRSLHGVGKTTVVAIAIIWFCLTRDAAGVDWKCPTTAGAWRQLESYLWPEIHKFVARLRWDVIGRQPFTRNELLRNNLNLTYGSAFAVASDVPAYIEGVHADAVFYIFDESKSIPAATFDAAEGAFSGEGEAFGLSTSTPGEPVGRFYEIQSQKPGFEDWHPIHVSLKRAVAAGRVSVEWAEQRKHQWGENSALYANRVLGEFHSSDSEGLVPLGWVEAAIERWETNKNEPLEHLDRVGVDVARMGSDKTCMALLCGHRIAEIRLTALEDTMETAGRVGGILTAHTGTKAVVDTDGLGAGVTDRLREQGYDVVAFHGGSKSTKKDRSGELGFLNLRAEALWALREALDPAFNPIMELPPDDALIGDLTTPHWMVTSNSRIQIEAKDQIRTRLGRSTDHLDAVAMACWMPRVRRLARMYDTRLVKDEDAA